MGLVRLSAFFLQTLSAEPAFGAKLNAPVDLKLGALAKYAVPGTLGDFLIVRRRPRSPRCPSLTQPGQVSIYTLIFTTKAKLASLYPAFVLAVTNEIGRASCRERVS